MSVLLEALKKAAEEKKRAKDDANAVAIPPSELDTLSISDVPALKLSTLDEGFSIKPLVEDESPLIEDVKTASNPEFTLNEMSGELPSSATLADIHPDNTSVTHNMSSSLDVFEEDDSTTSAFKEPAATDDLDFIFNEPIDEPVIEETLRTETSNAYDQSPLNLDSNSSNFANNLDEHDQDSFEWSMNALPGYTAATVDDSKPLEQNPILLSGALTSEPKRSKKPIYSKGLFFLVMVLFFFGIGFYGLMYYQEQNEELENSMRKYELAKMEFSLPKIKSPTVESVASKAELSMTSKAIPIETVDQGSDLSANDFQNRSQTSSDAEEVVSLDNSGAIDAKLKRASKSVSLQVNSASNSHADSHQPSAKVNIKKVPRSRTVVTESKRALMVDNSTETFLTEAYAAYESGQLELAESKFKRVLSIDPRNLTALLGLGGISASQNQPRLAMGHYQKALEVEPESLVVYEAIANLSTSIELNSEWNDSLLKMVDTYPSSSTLQYALGNLYSSNNDWLAAQECYFKAYALDMNNPDFMVNLAVSLDHLGKYPLAAQYYTQALASADSQKVNFDVSSIKNRLISIRQYIAQEK